MLKERIAIVVYIFNLFIFTQCDTSNSNKQFSNQKIKSVVIQDLHPPKRNYWPTQSWQKKTLSQVNIHPQKFQKVIDDNCPCNHPLRMKYARRFIGTFAKAQYTILVFVHTSSGIHNI